MVREAAYKGESLAQRHLPVWLSLVESKHAHRVLKKYDGDTDLEKFDEFMKPFLLRDKEEVEGYQIFRKYMDSWERLQNQTRGSSITVKDMQNYVKAAPMMSDKGQERLNQRIIERIEAERQGTVKLTWRQRISRRKWKKEMEEAVNEVNEKFGKKNDDDQSPPFSR